MVNLPPKCASTYLGCHTLPMFKPKFRLLSPRYPDVGLTAQSNVSKPRFLVPQ